MEVIIESSEILCSISDAISFGISMGEKLSGHGSPSETQRAQQRMESLSLGFMLSSLLEGERVGMVAPMTYADLRRLGG